MAKEIIKKVARWSGVELARRNKQHDYFLSLYKKYEQYTMIPQALFLNNLDLCSHFKTLPGNFVECGVWRGGMAAAIGEVIADSAHIHLFDSFEGLPPAKEIDGQAALTWQADTQSDKYYDNCSADESFVKTAMEIGGLKNFSIHKGWFENTLKNYDRNSIAILRLDGDWYDSIKTCLEQLYSYVIEGGIIILDDYHTWDGCTKAVHDYLSEIKSASRISQWNNQVAYIIKKN